MRSRFRRSSALRLPTTVVVDRTSGITVTTSRVSTTYRWSAIARTVETPRCFVAVLEGVAPVQFVVIAKRGCQPATQQVLRELLKR